MEFLVGTGLAVAAIGLALFLGVPPPGWPKMPKPLVQFCLGAAVCLVISGLSLMAVGGCQEDGREVCKTIIGFWSSTKFLAAAGIVLCACIGGVVGILLHPETSRRRRLSTFGPWILIIGGPLIGLLWLYLQHSPAPKKSDATHGPSPTQTVKPDVTIRLIYPDYPALVLVNNSDKLAREIKWSVAIWNLDDPRTYVNPYPAPNTHDPLPFPVSVFDFLRPKSESGPQQLFGSQHVRPYVKEGQNIFGSIGVICPECAKGHTYVVFWTVGRTGWYTEISGLGGRTFSEGELIIPHHFTRELIQAYAQEALAQTPASVRIPIGPGSISSSETPPSVLLVPAEDRLLLHNQNTYELGLWGDKFGDELASMETQKRIIPVGAHYYFLNDLMTEYARRHIGANGERTYPFDIYLETPNGKHYTAKFFLLIKMQKNAMGVHTQHLGVIEGGW